MRASQEARDLSAMGEGLSQGDVGPAWAYVGPLREGDQFEPTPFDHTRGSAEFGFKFSGSSCPAGRCGGAGRSVAADSMPPLVESAEASGIVHHDKLWQPTGCAHGATCQDAGLLF